MYAFFTSCTMSLVLFGPNCDDAHLNTRYLRYSSGGVAANKSGLASTLKSVATMRHLTLGADESPLLPKGSPPSRLHGCFQTPPQNLSVPSHFHARQISVPGHFHARQLSGSPQRELAAARTCCFNPPAGGQLFQGQTGRRQNSQTWQPIQIVCFQSMNRFSINPVV